MAREWKFLAYLVGGESLRLCGNVEEFAAYFWGARALALRGGDLLKYLGGGDLPPGEGVERAHFVHRLIPPM